MAPQKVLIVNTNGGGHANIGFWLAKTLAAQGHQVTLNVVGSQDDKKMQKPPFTYFSELTSAGVTVPVETKNLTGVIVEAYRIYADNTLQFLQVNELDGTNEMVRVGDPVWSGSFTFNWDPSMKNRLPSRPPISDPVASSSPSATSEPRSR